MTGTESIIRDMDYFFSDVYEKQKELDLKIYTQSLPKNIFKKKDYAGNVEEYKAIKNLALKIDTASYEPDASDDELLELIVSFDELLALFNLYCDRGIAVQELLRLKAEGTKYKNSEYSEAADKFRSIAKILTTKLNDFNAEYSVYKESRL